LATVVPPRLRLGLEGPDLKEDQEALGAGGRVEQGRAREEVTIGQQTMWHSLQPVARCTYRVIGHRIG
jgi:hypothetical protein